jgi:hypothetical protein
MPEGRKGCDTEGYGGLNGKPKAKDRCKKDVKKVAGAAKKKRAIIHLSKATRAALGKQAASVARKKRKQSKG